MARRMMEGPAGTDNGGNRQETMHDAGSARRSFMKLATATATLTGLAMTVKMTAKAIEADDKNQLCRGSDRFGAICTSCTVDCTLSAEV